MRFPPLQQGYMSKLDELKAAADAARAGMGVEETAEEVTVETETEETQDPDEVEETATPVEKATEETDDTESEEVETTEEKKETETVEKESAETSQPPKGVFKEFNELRTQKRQAEATVKTLLEMVGATSAEDAVAKITELRATAPLSEEFIQAAKEMGVEDPQNLKKLSDLITKQVRGEINGEIAPLKEQIAGYEQTAEAMRSEQEFGESVKAMDKEWDAVLPVIEAEYKPTPTMAKEAHDLMVALAHSEKYHDKEIDYILYKEQEQFEAIFGSKKRKTMLPARGAPIVNKEQEGALPKAIPGDHDSIVKAQKKLKQIASSQDFSEDDKDRI